MFKGRALSLWRAERRLAIRGRDKEHKPERARFALVATRWQLITRAGMIIAILVLPCQRPPSECFGVVSRSRGLSMIDSLPQFVRYAISRKRIRTRHALCARWSNVPGWPDAFCLKLYTPAR